MLLLLLVGLDLSLKLSQSFYLEGSCISGGLRSILTNIKEYTSMYGSCIYGGLRSILSNIKEYTSIHGSCIYGGLRSILSNIKEPTHSAVLVLQIFGIQTKFKNSI